MLRIVAASVFMQPGVAELFAFPASLFPNGGVEMAVAHLKAHAPQSFWTVINHGGPAVLFCFLFLYLSGAGAGPWRLDALRHRESTGL